MKKHFFYTVLTIFAATAILTLLGVAGLVPIKDNYLWALVTSLLLELAAAVIAAFRNTDFFTEESEAALRQSQADQIQAQQQTIAALTDQVAQLAREVVDEQEARRKQQADTTQRLKALADRIPLVPKKIARPIPPSPASGSAPPWKPNEQ